MQVEEQQGQAPQPHQALQNQVQKSRPQRQRAQTHLLQRRRWLVFCIVKLDNRKIRRPNSKAKPIYPNPEARVSISTNQNRFKFPNGPIISYILMEWTLNSSIILFTHYYMTP